MAHMMGLYDEPFALMKTGKKTVEVRLNDSKRQKLRLGDGVEFIKAPVQDDRLQVTITKLKTYETFRQLYEDIPLDQFGEKNVSIEELLSQIHAIYSKEQEKEFGVVAIYVKRIDE